MSRRESTWPVGLKYYQCELALLPNKELHLYRSNGLPPPQFSLAGALSVVVTNFMEGPEPPWSTRLKAMTSLLEKFWRTQIRRLGIEERKESCTTRVEEDMT